MAPLGPFQSNLAAFAEEIASASAAAPVATVLPIVNPAGKEIAVNALAVNGNTIDCILPLSSGICRVTTPSFTTA